MSLLSRSYRFINLLSIDIAFGAMASAAFYACLLHAHVRHTALAALGVTVWVIYTTDHLLDARALTTRASTERHRFHQDNYKTLWLCVVLAIIADGLIILYIRKPVLLRGVILSSCIVVYLLLQRYLRVLKELIAGLLYAGGVLMPSMTISSRNFSPEVYFIIVPFVITAWINLLLFAWFDRQQDTTDRRHSFVTVMGEQATRWIIGSLFLGNLALLVVSAMYQVDLRATMILALMNAVLLCILFWRDYFSLHDRYRLLGDAVFLFPVIYFVL